MRYDIINISNGLRVEKTSKKTFEKSSKKFLTNSPKYDIINIK